MKRTIALSGGFLLVLSFAAFAQTTATVTAPPGGTIAIGGAWTAFSGLLQPVLGTIVTALIAWAAAKFTAYTHVNIESKYRDSLHSAAMTGVNLALSKIDKALSGMTISTKSSIVAEATSWVIASVPDALKYLGITPDKVSLLVTSKLNALLGADTTTATVSAAPSAGGNA